MGSSAYRVMVTLPKQYREEFAGLRRRGFTNAGYIRSLIESDRERRQEEAIRKGTGERPRKR